MIIKYVGPIFTPDSDGAIARGYILALSDKFSVHISSKDTYSPSYLQEDVANKLMRMVITNVPYNCVIHHVRPPDMEIEPGKINVGVVYPKTTTIPANWISPYNKLDLIITTSSYSKNSIISSGVITPVVAVPPPVDTNIYRPTSPLNPGIDLPTFKILTIFSPTHSSNWVDICMAYLQEFDAGDDVILVIKSNTRLVSDALANMSAEFTSPPMIYSIVDTIDELQMPSLYSMCNLFYLPARGKSHGLAYVQSMACGVPCICTDSGGHMDILNSDNAYIVSSTPHPATPSVTEPDYDERLMWHRPLNLCSSLRDAYTLTNSGNQLDLTIPESYSVDYVSMKLAEALTSLEVSTLKSRRVDVSIIILSYNNLPMLSKTMEMVSANTIYPNYEVIVVDNGSDRNDAELFDYLNKLDCKVIYSRRNLGFGGGNNLAAASSSGSILLFLNNDTEPQSYWLTPIVDIFRDDDSAGVVGSKLLFPNMTVQHVGIAYGGDGPYYASHPLIGRPHDYPLASIRREQLAVTGACLAIRRDIFKSVGGFDPVYERGYYEDSDLCMKVRELGYKVVCEPDSVVVHKVGSSFRKLGELRRLDFFNQNESTFKDRWGGKLIPNEYMFRSLHYYAPSRLNVCLLNSYMQTYGGGEREVATVANTLENDNNVDIIMRLPNQVTRKLIVRNLGINLRHTELVTLVSAEPIRLFRDYDVFWNNEWKSMELGAGRYNILRVMFPSQPNDDLTWLDSYDKILANSKYTQEWIGEYWDAESEVLYPPVTMMAELDEVDTLISNGRNYILTVGRFFRGEHCKMHKVMIQAYMDMNLDGWELHLAGIISDPDYYHECVQLAGSRGDIVFHPNISYNELRGLYRISMIYWHATGYGTDDPMAAEHFGIAPVEAMSAGCYPVLVGKGGLVEISPSIPTWDTMDELVDITKDIIDGPSQIDHIMNRARKFSVDKFVDGVQSIIAR